MTDKQPDARLRILAAAAGLVTEAGQAGLVVTIETAPQQPLAMGNYKMAISVRDKREAAAPAAEVGQVVDAAPATFDTRDQRIQVLEDALRFYADGCHFNLSDKDAWDTVSGEPQNFWCDEEGTATMEDGTVAAMALKGTPLLDEEEQTLPAMGAEALVRQMLKALDDATGKDTSGFEAMEAASAWLASRPVQEAAISSYTLPITNGRFPKQLKVERSLRTDGSYSWAVRSEDGDCLTQQGTWEWEPQPSSRDDAFLARCRFASAELALAAARAAIRVIHEGAPHGQPT